MRHISARHDLDVADRITFPMAGYPIQVRFADGTVKDGLSNFLLPKAGSLPVGTITGWRYIRNESMK